MRVSREVMASHQTQILEAAAELFRAHGFERVSVAELMKEAGLTHGGFYGHFSSKEELIAQTAEHLLARSTKKWESLMENASSSDPVGAFAKGYLAIAHRTGKGDGCLFPTLGPELSRLPADIRTGLVQPLSRFFDRVGKFFQGKTSRQRRHASMVAFSTLIGAVVLSQAVDDRDLSKEIQNAVSASLMIPKKPLRTKQSSGSTQDRK